MQVLNIGAVPNQTFSTTLDNDRYDFAIYQANGIMCYDVAINEIPVLNGQRLMPGVFLISFFAYQQAGNFLLLTSNGQLADYTQFGTTQTLIYLSTAEIQAAINAGKYSIVAPVIPYAVAD